MKSCDRVLDNIDPPTLGKSRVHYFPGWHLDADGNIVDVSGRERVSLCRCGGSTKKPFCDGTHSKIGFQGAIEAVEKAEGS